MTTKKPKQPSDRQAAKLASKEKKAERLEKYESMYHCKKGRPWQFKYQCYQQHSYSDSARYRKLNFVPYRNQSVPLPNHLRQAILHQNPGYQQKVQEHLPHLANMMISDIDRMYYGGYYGYQDLQSEYLTSMISLFSELAPFELVHLLEDDKLFREHFY